MVSVSSLVGTSSNLFAIHTNSNIAAINGKDVVIPAGMPRYGCTRSVV
jgi:hypothetical protein